MAPSVLHDIMGRRPGSVARSQVRIADPEAFASVVRSLVQRGVYGATGVRAVAELTGIPAPRLSEWTAGRRRALSREQFAALFNWVTAATAQNGVAELESLLYAVELPEDGGGLFPLPPQTDPFARRREHARFLEDVITRATESRLARGVVPADESPFWSEDLGVGPLWVRPRVFDFLRRLLVPPPAFDADGEEPHEFETERGTRYRVRFPRGRIAPPDRA